MIFRFLTADGPECLVNARPGQVTPVSKTLRNDFVEVAPVAKPITNLPSPAYVTFGAALTALGYFASVKMEHNRRPTIRRAAGYYHRVESSEWDCLHPKRQALQLSDFGRSMRKLAQSKLRGPKSTTTIMGCRKDHPRR